MSKKRFVFNDESENSYGFIIPTTGIDISRFKKNPMMLDGHISLNSYVIGKWDDVKVDDSVLTGLPVFDTEDENASKIAGKVERGFISTCSMGVRFNRDNLKYIAGKLILEKCELYEVSIVPVPSNANSIRLYDSNTGDLMKEDEVQNLCLSIIGDSKKAVETEPSKKSNSNNTQMKIKLEAAANKIFGLQPGAEIDVAELSAKIVELDAQKKAGELKLTAIVEAQEAEKLEAINEQVEAALQAGKITADNKQKFIELGIANPELLTSTLEAIPNKKSLRDEVKNKGIADVATAEDFQKLSFEAQLEFKKTRPDQYQKIFTIKS